MSDLQSAPGYEAVVLTDRTGKGGCEFRFDNRAFVFKPGKTDMIVPRFVAEWLFKYQKEMVHTRDGAFVCRFGIKDGPADLLELIGAHAFETDLIEIDEGLLEGWDAPSRAGEKIQVKKLRTQPGDFAHQGAPRGGTFSAKERGSEP